MVQFLSHIKQDHSLLKIAQRPLAALGFVLQCLLARIVNASRLFDFMMVLQRPLMQRLKRRFKRSTKRRNPVFHGDRRRCDHAAFDDAIALQPTQRMAQCLLSDALQLTP